MSSRGGGAGGVSTRGHKSSADDDGSVLLSKCLSQMLRHGALERGLKVYPGGWVDLQDLLALKRFSRWTADNVRSVVELDDKQRFALRTVSGSETLQIRANRGHSFAVDLEENGEISADRQDANSKRVSSRGGGKGRFRGHRSSDPNVLLSKSLSQVLRHGALKEGLKVYPGGWVELQDLLTLKRFSRWTVDDVRSVVESNDKQRFGLRTFMGESGSETFQIRANQGHSFAVDLENEVISLERPESLPPVVIHGTYSKTWSNSDMQIRGLSKMGRNEIHFSPGLSDVHDGVISGIRQSADVLVYIDLPKALKDGLKFFRSANNVILCPGDAEGYLAPQYFEKVVHRKSGKILYPSP